ncbi:hypothetical protein PUN28_010066 [Cardiocondyla obscurior]|uniref:Uncharacterized protein n=1 Tax=Cardiocondyla obscurior TaxID=286306 RepID=A0AAW2FNB1_9HYME
MCYGIYAFPASASEGCIALVQNCESFAYNSILFRNADSDFIQFQWKLYKAIFIGNGKQSSTTLLQAKRSGPVLSR